MASQASPSQDRDLYADRRLHPRVEVALPAFLRADFDRHAVQIVDLSNGGAKLTCAAELASGTSVTLHCGTLSRAAVVRWQNAEFVGIAFETELDPRDVRALIARSHAMTDRMAPPK